MRNVRNATINLDPVLRCLDDSISLSMDSTFAVAVLYETPGVDAMDRATYRAVIACSYNPIISDENTSD